ncbi:MAG: type VI secretion system baseplate subunit TssF [Planctomycetota bacterium]
MSEELLPYYNRELDYLRKVGERFAQDHPKIAGRLRLGSETAPDPHVERLIESVAFLNARVQHRIDEGFPEISDALLSIVQPNSTAPVPSMSIVRFAPDDDATAAYRVPREAAIETERVDGVPCTYRTVFETDVVPLEVRDVQLLPTPFDAPSVPRAREAAACLRVSLRSTGEASISDLGLSSLRFHIRGLPQHAYPLYELMLNDAIGAAVAATPSDPNAVSLAADALQPVGFEPDEACLPSADRAPSAYRLLTEFFAFPQKFLFVDVHGLDAVPGSAGRELELFVFLRRLPAELDRFVERETLELNCTPIVNLFTRRAEPIRFDHLDFEQRIVPDARRPRAMEVHSVDRLTTIDEQGETRDVRPFYGIDHGPDGDPAPAFWHATRRPGHLAAENADDGTEVYLQVVDLEFDPARAESLVLTAETTCTNRNLPQSLPYGAGRPRMNLASGGGIGGIECLQQPTKTLRPSLGDAARWKLISLLSLNFLSLSDAGGSARPLREMLRIYDMVARPETQKLIDSILELRSEPTVSRVRIGGQPAFCRGVAVTLVLDETKFSGSGLYLFASLLERFLALHASVNSFVQTSLETNLRDGVVKRWPPRAGNRPLV